MFSATPSPPADILVREGDIIQVGTIGLKVIHTPGHSPGGMSLYLDGMVFTGDTAVYPGHNDGSTPSSTIQYERRHNPFVRG